ncbi:hypothetical protein Ccrd_016702 [Cynara cardunculus var. scolymus]|uniref:Uncharacterized protein n=1 Tax=Cynara cardunculus var. scolymus TaxID=59895 RepID=A0A103Y9G0_CYNCS|nr:hypothetical protein Ccrd_016702 [Cynara cardunculus var. scolymus]
MEIKGKSTKKHKTMIPPRRGKIKKRIFKKILNMTLCLTRIQIARKKQRESIMTSWWRKLNDDLIIED